jgi:hypothetical protein
MLNAFDELLHAKTLCPLQRTAPNVQLATKSLKYGSIEIVVVAGIEHRGERVL